MKIDRRKLIKNRGRHKLPLPLAYSRFWTSRKLCRKSVVVGDGLFDELLEQEQLGAVDDGMDALLEGLHGREGLERVAEQDDGGVAALVHGHGLQRLQRQVFLDVVGGEQFLDDDDLIVDLAEADQEIAVGGGGVDLVAEFGQGGFGGLQPFRRGKGEQGRLVRRC